MNYFVYILYIFFIQSLKIAHLFILKLIRSALGHQGLSTPGTQYQNNLVIHFSHVHQCISSLTRNQKLEKKKKRERRYKFHLITVSALSSFERAPPASGQSSPRHDGCCRAWSLSSPRFACARGWRCGRRSRSGSPATPCTPGTRGRNPCQGGEATEGAQCFLRAFWRRSGELLGMSWERRVLNNPLLC